MSLSDVVRHSAKQITTETYDEVGFNFRMTDMQAAIGITQLGRLEELLMRRRYLATRYTKALQNLPGYLRLWFPLTASTTTNPTCTFS